MISEQQDNEFIEESINNDTESGTTVESVSRETVSENQEYDYSDVEKEAMARGWKPKDQFYGEETDYIPAKEFLDRGNLYGRIAQQNQIIRGLEKKINNLADISNRQYESQIQDKTAYYIQLKHEAIRNGDVDEVARIEHEYQKLYGHPQNYQTSYQKSPSDPYVDEFKHRNSRWFNSDTDENYRMMGFAIDRDNELLGLYPDWNVEKRHREVEESVKRAYPHRFTNMRRNLPPTVNMPNRENVPIKRNKPKGFNDLPPEWKLFVEDRCKFYGHPDKDAYARELYEMGEIK